MFEPFFDQYLASVTFNGGRPVYVPLHPPPADKFEVSGEDWTINFDELRLVVLSLHVYGLLSMYSRAAITPKTKVIMVNTPHNPVGKVFTRKELEAIAALAEEFNLLIISDEVVSRGSACS